MPLVRIDLLEGRSDGELQAIADTVQQCMVDVFAAPPRDRYQILTEHRPGRMFSVVENSTADWSFGMGRAQFLTGELWKPTSGKRTS